MRELNRISLIIGQRGTGKTTFGLQLVNASPLKKKLIIDTFEHPSYKEFETITAAKLPRWIKGKKRLLYRTEEDMDMINDYVYNTLIVMEDCTKYLTGDLKQNIKSILFDSKQKNNDIIMMYHGFSFIPPKILANCTDITLFKVGENINNHKSKIPSFETIHKAHQAIQASSNIYERKTIIVN